MTTQTASSKSLIWPTMLAGVLSGAMLFAVVLATGPADAAQLSSFSVEAQNK